MTLLQRYHAAIARKHVAESLARLAHDTTNPAKWRCAAQALRLAEETLPYLAMMRPLRRNWIHTARLWQGRADRLEQKTRLLAQPRAA